jgi:hypothetical protein
VIDVGVSAFAAATRSPVKVETWIDDLTIRSMSKRGQLKWPMEPDFVLILTYEKQRIVLLGEADMGTEDMESARPTSLSSKYENYKTFYRTVRPHDPWLKELPQPHTMFIFQGERRLENALEMIARKGGRSSYHFTLQKHLEPPYSFYGEVWQRIGLEGYHSVMELFTS